MIIATAPGRCALVGEPTDCFGGSVLACATRERARCALDDDVADFVVTVGGVRAVLRNTADLAGRGDGPLDIARAVLAALEITPGKSAPVHLLADTDLPRGLAGPTALLAAMTACCLTHCELRLTLYETAELARKIDADFLDGRCGYADHYMAVFGGLNFLDFRGKETGDMPDPAPPFAVVEPLERSVPDLPLLAATFRPASAAPSAPQEVWEQWRGSEPAIVAARRETARLARLAKRALLTRDWPSLGAVLTQSHRVRAGVEGENAIAEAWVAAALAAGAEGAQAAGQGDALTLVAVIRDRERAEQALRDAGAAALFSPCPSPGLTVSVEVTV